MSYSVAFTAWSARVREEEEEEERRMKAAPTVWRMTYGVCVVGSVVCVVVCGPVQVSFHSITDTYRHLLHLISSISTIQVNKQAIKRY